MKRKGISPLIAAVLLIVFTVAIGAVVLNWMTSYTKGTTEKAGTDTTSTVECSKQILDITDVTVTSSAGTIDVAKVFIQNLGSANAKLSTLTIYDDAGNIYTNTSLYPSDLPAGGMVILSTPNLTQEGYSIDANQFTVRITSDCGASDTYSYPTA